MIPACLLMILVGFALSCPLTALMRRTAFRIGQLDAPGRRKIHTRPVPVTGGVAIFWSIAIPMTLGILTAWALPPESWTQLLPDLRVHLAGLRVQTPMAMALLGSMLLLHVIGLIDDRKNLGPFLKLFVQLLAALTLVLGHEVRLFEWYGPVLSITLTVLWFLIITNAFNFLDNMDGLSAGVATITASIFLAATLLAGQWFVAALLGLFIGALLGFLVFNFPPASIFMGDGGSLVVGFLIAFISVRVTYYDPETPVHWWAVFTPLVVLAIPLYDLLSVTMIRILQKKSPFQGDTQHFSHRLVRKGLSRPAAVGVIYACTLATGLGGIILGRLEAWQAVMVLIQTVAILLVVALLERTPNYPGSEP